MMDTVWSGDAISRLPDEVLGSILSLLPTEQAVSTCLLSSRWRYVFRLVDNLDFDASDSGEDKQARYVFRERYKSFVDRTLALLCHNPIKKFSLKCYVDSSEDNNGMMACMTRWISNVMERGVLEVDLRLKYWNLYDLPPQLLACKTLVKLKLGTGLFLGPITSDVSLPSLKILFIDTVYFYFEYENFSSRLLAGCPVLEELTVHHKDSIARPHTISTPTVKRLSVEYRCLVRDDHMSFDLPNLVYLDYSDFALAEYKQVNLESLVEAKLDLHPAKKVERPDLTNLIVGIRHVEILHLSGVSVDVINSCCKHGMFLPVFENLVNLSFGCKNKQGWELVAYLLKQSPKLRTLKIRCYQRLCYQGTADDWKQLKSLLDEFNREVVRVDVVEEGDGNIIKRDLTMLLGV